MDHRSYRIVNKNCRMLLPNPFLFELAMEEYIIEHPDVLTLSKEYTSPVIEDYEIAKTHKRYDIVARYEDSNTLAIIETKKGKLDMSAINQLKSYLAEDRKDPLVADKKIGVLVGTEIDSRTIENIEKSTNLFAIVLNRYNQDIDEIIHTTIYSPKKSIKRNYTKYTLTTKDNRVYTNLGKCRLVLEIIRAFIEEHPISLSELQREFPANLANRGKNSKMLIVRDSVFLDEEENLRVRYFKETLHCSDSEIVVCNQWGKSNINKMIRKATDLGMTITIQNN